MAHAKKVKAIESLGEIKAVRSQGVSLVDVDGHPPTDFLVFRTLIL